MTRMLPELWERVPPEAWALFLEMAETIKRLEARVVKQDRRIAELERRLGQTPQNSSLPPSNQHPHAKPVRKPKRKPPRKRGGQPRHKKHERALVPSEQVDETVVLKPTACRRCGQRLAGADPKPRRHHGQQVTLSHFLDAAQPAPAAAGFANVREAAFHHFAAAALSSPVVVPLCAMPVVGHGPLHGLRSALPVLAAVFADDRFHGCVGFQRQPPADAAQARMIGRHLVRRVAQKPLP